MSNKYLPFLESEASFPSFSTSFQAFAATERIGRIFRDGTVRPALAANNATQEVKDKAMAALHKFEEDDERGLGFLVLALEKVPLIRNKLLTFPAVRAAPASGMALWRALRDEILNNPNRSVYTAILDRIDMYQAKDTPLPEAILALDNLYAMLPAELHPTDSAKCLQLRHSLPKHYADTVHTASIANPLASYSSVCESLLSEYRSQVVLQLKSPTVERDTVNLITASIAPPVAISEAHAIVGDETHKRHKAASFRGGRRRSQGRHNKSRSRSRDSNYSHESDNSSVSKDSFDYSRSHSRGRPKSPSSRRQKWSTRSSSPRRHVSFEKDKSDVQCWTCKGWGHVSSDGCPSKKN